MSFTRDLKIVLTDAQKILRKNFGVSFSVIFVMVTTLFLISLTLVFYGVLDTSIKQVERRVDVDIYFVPDTPKKETDKILTELQSFPEIKELEYISQEEALKIFLQKYGKDELIRSSIDELGENPLGPSIHIEAKNPEDYAHIMEKLEEGGQMTSPYIDYVNYQDHSYIIQRLHTFSSTLKKISYAFGIFLLFISVLIIVNVLSITLYSLKDEIRIKRVLGAENRYIWGPLAGSAILYGTISALIVLILFIPLSSWLEKTTKTFLGGMSIHHYYIMNMPYFAIIIISAGILIAYLSTLILIRRFMKF